jgi:sporulation protein YlmC with PRC-barrel domain
MKLFEQESIRGKPVIDGAGRVIGELSALLFDVETWRVEVLRVKLRSEVADALGERRGPFRPALVDVPIRFVTGLGDAVVMSVPITDLRRQGEAAALPSQPPFPPTH